jgi:hypothetical protein
VDNVVKFGEATPHGMVNEELIQMLEGLMARAKSGEIVGLAYAYTDGDDVCGNGWESGSHNIKLAASVGILFHAFNAGFIGD